MMKFLIVGILLFLPLTSWAKPASEQDEVILLNDSASDFEESNPALAKSLTEFANEREKQWEYDNASKNVQPVPITDADIPRLEGQIKLLKRVIPLMRPTYPVIAQGLIKMVGEINKKIETEVFHGIFIGMSQADFLKIYPMADLRTFRHEGGEDWLTYNEPVDDPVHETVTFYFIDQKLMSWKLDDRPEVVKEYLGEFCFYQEPSLIYQAVSEVLLRMPYKDFLSVTRRQRPMLFTEFYLEGTARFASSSEFIVTPDDPPCCKEGFTIVKLGMGLGAAKTPAPIEGVVAHEIAHRVLDSIRKGQTDCNAERRANRLIKQWGFKEEFKEASRLFGQKKGDPAGCQETTQKN